MKWRRPANAKNVVGVDRPIGADETLPGAVDEDARRREELPVAVPANGEPVMERHCVQDFAVDPVDGIVWGLLVRPPSTARVSALELLVVDGISGASVTTEQRRLSLPTAHHNEIDALGALLALTGTANRIDAISSPGSGRYEFPAEQGEAQ
jgi:hypothetical protein